MRVHQNIITSKTLIKKKSTAQEWKQVQVQTNESELNLQQVIHYYQNATDEQKHEIINEMKKAGYDDEFIFEFLSATVDEFVPKSRR